MLGILELEPENPAVVYRSSLSPGSYSALQNALKTVAAILSGETTDPWTFPWHEVRYRHVAHVRHTLIRRYAPATVNRMLSALRQVLKHAWRLGDLEHEAFVRAADVANVRVPARPKGRAVELDEINALFGTCAADPSPAGRRDAALFAVLYGAGLRRAELCALDVADFAAECAALSVRNGKGGHHRTLYLNPEACGYVVVWLEARGNAPGPIFCPVRRAGRVRCTRLRGESVYYIVQRRQREAGLEGVTPHGLRRYAESRIMPSRRRPLKLAA